MAAMCLDSGSLPCHIVARAHHQRSWLRQATESTGAAEGRFLVCDKGRPRLDSVSDERHPDGHCLVLERFRLALPRPRSSV